MNRWLLLIVIFGAIYGASSCKFLHKFTGRKATTAVDSSSVVLKADSLSVADTGLHIPDSLTASPVIDIQNQALLQHLLPVWNRQIAYNTFSARAKVHYDGGGESHDFTAAIRMEHDKRIWISVTAFGFEIARALLTPDSIVVLDRIHTDVRMLRFADAGNLFPVRIDFATLQTLIMGDALHAGSSPTSATAAGDSVMLYTSTPVYQQQAIYTAADSTLRRQELQTGSSTSSIQYSDYAPVGNRRFSGTRTMQFLDNGARYNLALEFAKVSFDEPVDMSFAIPSKYNRK